MVVVLLPLNVTLKLVTHKLVYERLGVASTRVDVEHVRAPISGTAKVMGGCDMYSHGGTPVNEQCNSELAFTQTYVLLPRYGTFFTPVYLKSGYLG